MIYESEKKRQQIKEIIMEAETKRLLLLGNKDPLYLYQDDKEHLAYLNGKINGLRVAYAVFLK